MGIANSGAARCPSASAVATNASASSSGPVASASIARAMEPSHRVTGCLSWCATCSTVVSSELAAAMSPSWRCATIRCRHA